MFAKFPLLRVIKRIALFAGFQSSLFRHTCVIQHAVHIDLPEVLRRQYINTAAHLDPGFLPLVYEVVLHRLNYILFIGAHLLLVLNTAENGKTVRRNPSDGFLICHKLHGFGNPEFKKRVPGFPTIAVVDEFEIPDIVIGKEVRGIRVRPQQLLYPLPEPVHAERAGELVIIHQFVQLLLVLQAKGALLQHGNRNEGYKQKRHQKYDQTVTVQIIGQIILI